MQPWQTLPEKFLQKLDHLVPEDKKQTVLMSFTREKPVSIRINTLKGDNQTVLKELEENNIPYSPVSWYNDAFIVHPPTKQHLTDLPLYKQGHFYIQNLSSMLPALVLNPQPGELVLDLCASPGSKTTQMAAMMHNTGQLVANDRSRQRMFKLQANLKEQGVTNTKLLTKPGEILWKFYPNYFDKVLVDAPCSMEGRFIAADPETYRDWSPKKVKLLAQSQKWLLRSAFTMTKPGGTLVYSTCTLSPEENEEILEWLLKTEKYPMTIDPIRLQGLSSQITGQSSQIANALRILPDNQMEGFFVAKIVKG